MAKPCDVLRQTKINRFVVCYSFLSCFVPKFSFLTEAMSRVNIARVYVCECACACIGVRVHVYECWICFAVRNCKLCQMTSKTNTHLPEINQPSDRQTDRMYEGRNNTYAKCQNCMRLFSAHDIRSIGYTEITHNNNTHDTHFFRQSKRKSSCQFEARTN